MGISNALKFWYFGALCMPHFLELDKSEFVSMAAIPLTHPHASSCNE